MKHNQIAVIHDLPYGTQYTVTEKDANKNKYLTTVKGVTDGTLQSDVVIGYENRRTAASVDISKTVSSINGMTAPQDGTISNGDTIKLKHGQTISIFDLPEGAIVTVTEIEDDLFGTTVAVTPRGETSGNSGTIYFADGSGSFNISFTNTRFTGGGRKRSADVLSGRWIFDGIICRAIFHHLNKKKTSIKISIPN